MRQPHDKPRHDADQVRARASLLELAREAVPGLRREGREWVGLCPFHRERSGSFHVNEQKNLFRCHGCEAGGGAIDFVMRLEGMTYGQALDYLAARVGLSPSSARARPLTMRVQPKAPEADDRRRRQNVEHALRIWSESVESDSTMAQLYLMGRGIDVDARGGMPGRLRFSHLLKHTQSGKSFPCMVGYITGPGGKFQGVHRTFLSFDSPANHPAAARALAARLGRMPDRVVVKAAVPSAKTMLGTAGGGGVGLWRPGPILAIAEGIETALSVQQGTGLPCWAALSLGNMGGLAVPDEVCEVVLCADNDMKDPAAAEKILQAAARNYERQGLGVTIARPPKGMDFNDVLMEEFR